VRAFGVGAALVDVADEQVGTAGVAELADLAQQLLRSPASSTPSMTSTDNPENTVPTSFSASIMTNRVTSILSATAETATEPTT
jgi:hypothetical protein